MFGRFESSSPQRIWTVEDLTKVQVKWLEKSLTHKFEYVWKSEISNENQFVTDVSNCSVWPAAADAVSIGWKISKIFLQNNACHRCVKFLCCTVRGVRWLHRFSSFISFDAIWRKGNTLFGLCFEFLWLICNVA